MSADKQERIRIRAHQIWEREGRPDGREQEHWRQATREIEEAPADQENASASFADSEASGGSQPDEAGVFQPGETVPGGSTGGMGRSGGSTARKRSVSVGTSGRKRSG